MVMRYTKAGRENKNTRQQLVWNHNRRDNHLFPAIVTDLLVNKNVGAQERHHSPITAPL